MDMRGEMGTHASLITKSTEIYENALDAGSDSDGDKDGLRKESEESAQVKPPSVVQEIDDVDTFFEDAVEAYRGLLTASAGEWETKEITVEDQRSEKVVKEQEPVAGKAAKWVENAISPGRKVDESARRKMENNCKGHPITEDVVDQGKSAGESWLWSASARDGGGGAVKHRRTVLSRIEQRVMQALR